MKTFFKHDQIGGTFVCSLDDIIHRSLLDTMPRRAPRSGHQRGTLVWTQDPNSSDAHYVHHYDSRYPARRPHLHCAQDFAGFPFNQHGIHSETTKK